MKKPAGHSVGPGRRSLDLVVSAALLLLSSPVLALIAVLVKATSRGPVIFRQVRVGAGAKPFVMYKFRSMTVQSSGPHVTPRDDGRVTRVGRLIRRTSLDELPQLLNVLRGDMTLVGPRPETSELAARYPESCRWIFEQTPGMTGPCQIRLRDRDVIREDVADVESYYLDVLVPQRVSMDATYCDAPTLRATFRVLMETAAYVLGRKPRRLIVDMAGTGLVAPCQLTAVARRHRDRRMSVTRIPHRRPRGRSREGSR
jgi:lipopolysaccharide/colanic/teichoic acid biosynthesis glycosyltransferase